MFWVYVLKNEESNKIYIGQTQNIEKRLEEHNDSSFVKYGKNAFTKINKGRWLLIYKEEYMTRKEAIVREKYLKSHIGRDFIRGIMGR